MDAINTLQAIELEGRAATVEEQKILSNYVGWGSLPDAFDPDKPEWADEFLELQAALTPQEYEAARASTLNAHYTSPTVIKAIYEAVGNMGFEYGNILEPSAALGISSACCRKIWPRPSSTAWSWTALPGVSLSSSIPRRILPYRAMKTPASPKISLISPSAMYRLDSKIGRAHV